MPSITPALILFSLFRGLRATVTRTRGERVKETGTDRSEIKEEKGAGNSAEGSFSRLFFCRIRCSLGTLRWKEKNSIRLDSSLTYKRHRSHPTRPVYLFQRISKQSLFCRRIVFLPSCVSLCPLLFFSLSLSRRDVRSSQRINRAFYDICPLLATFLALLRGRKGREHVLYLY
jgi:hypothetical protein